MPADHPIPADNAATATPRRRLPRPLTLPVLVSSVACVGALRPGPGTWGSLVALLLVFLGPWGCLIAAALAAVLGLAAVQALRLPPQADPSWVVIDEVAGQALALAALPATTGWPGVILAFVLFRLFDILKPGPVGWADRQHGAVGIMLDDVIAGAIAAILILLLRYVYPGFPF